jgi:hypothetical protein
MVVLAAKGACGAWAQRLGAEAEHIVAAAHTANSRCLFSIITSRLEFPARSGRVVHPLAG